MATFTPAQLAKIRRFVANKISEIDYDKSIINAAAQSYEDYLVSTQSGAVSAMNTATSPYTFTGSEKILVGAAVFFEKYLADGGL